MDVLQLVKYEAVGNDFLVLVDLASELAFAPELVAALCDRHRGVGADGVIRLSASPRATVAMELKNADGSDAETSGNGLRCAALAVVDAGLATHELVIETVVGLVRCDVAGAVPGRAEVSVEMGEVAVDPGESPLVRHRAFRVSTGNPHLVLIGDYGEDELAAIDLACVGPPLEVAAHGGQNVEFVVAADPARLILRVWERGVGITEACGSGSVAAAAAAHFAGLTGARVTVENPGGDVVVSLDGADLARPLATLAGAARRVATVQVALGDLALEVRQ